MTIGEPLDRIARHRGRAQHVAPVLLACVLTTLGAAPLPAQSATCQFRGTLEALAERPSPLDSVEIRLGDASAKLCYGRPSTRGRAIVGEQDPYGVPWRMGANEPTTLHLPFPARVGDVLVEPGAYSLYAIPNPGAWTIVLNRNTNRWGIPISADVRAADLGSFTVSTTHLDEHVETLEFSFEPSSGSSGELVYRWERTGLRIPIARR